MSTDIPWRLQEITYEAAAQDYLRSLPPEHFMEATAQATQRAITLASLALVEARRSDVRVFNELLVQYPLGGRKIGQIVPDNMVVHTDQAIRATTSYNLPLEPVGPFWVLEYVSQGSKRKDYEGSFRKYERVLKVPYYLLFYPDNGELTLFRLNSKRRYVSVKPNEHDRYAIPELDLELALVDGWVRYWYRGELLPLPAELQRDLDEARQQRDEARRERDAARRQAEEGTRRAEDADRRADEEKRRADEAQRRLEAVEQELARLRGKQGRS
jgi:Uma2 family endonuclease